MMGSLFAPKTVQAGSAHDFSFKTIDGQPMPLAQYKGKAVLVVNTASQCGFTKQYDGLQALYEKYKDKGLIVLGVPSNDFGGQEPGTAEEIKDFCETNFSVDFPLADKQVVSGDDAHPFYKWAGEQVGVAGRPRWNFHKYLIAPDGHLADWFSTVTDPGSDKVTAAVEKLLPAS
ncbi:glutathione peroxidase [Lacibacterium aquatile]|uniref:Glutathione peroxidase n=2 Tax=Lacibacterium aquatile TaxID=1168082 RepID=A0ABW5DN43_9PROT